ncbi:unnamed protein product [Rotaria sp. Silwood2]|nr:unnamed protein product [Rotaria sp. Silwood2]CAF4480145.1 unnamed protein product [Rotaria sp. Silwood2]
MASYTFLPIPNNLFKDVQYGDEEFIEILLDERNYVEENMSLQKLYILPLIHDLPQIFYIYIYSTSLHKISYSNADYPKLRAIINENSPNADDQLLADIQTCRRDLMPMKIVKPVQRETKLLILQPLDVEEYSVVCVQDDDNSLTFDIIPIMVLINRLKTFSNILIKVPYNDQTKYEMLHECRIHYNNDKSAQNPMDLFEKTYQSNEALTFYTNDSFLYRLFNRAFRTENIDYLFIFRFFLADMYNHLERLYSEQFLNNPLLKDKKLILYRD